MKSMVVVFMSLCGLMLGCQGANSEFDIGLRKMKAVTSVGANQAEFRAALQNLASVSDGSQRCEKIMSTYKDSLTLWGLFTTEKYAKGARGGSEKTINIPVKNDRLEAWDAWDDQKRNWYQQVFDLAKAHPEIIARRSSETWYVSPDAVQVLWAKAAGM